MLSTEQIFTWLGIALCGMALLQLGLWSAQTLVVHRQNERLFKQTVAQLRQQVNQRAAQRQQQTDVTPGRWSGFRPFRVSQLVRETSVCTSVYLEPEDGKPIVGFRPGQHVTLKLMLPGDDKPTIRCYSLSDGPGKRHYRISVKVAPAPAASSHPAGKASTFINRHLNVGDRVELKAPSGHFFLDEESSRSIVLLAGGIGVTPMMSMVDHLLTQSSQRPILLCYGVRNGDDHAFHQAIKDKAAAHANFYSVNCFSSPNPSDVEGRDYQVSGFVSVDLLKKLLPNQDCDFYLCGPPPFMNSLYSGLIAWGINDAQIHFESFGPASIKRKNQTASVVSSPTTDSSQPQPTQPSAATSTVRFAKSDVQIAWNEECESLLELAEQGGVPIESGCRAGNCGTCETSLRSGAIEYPAEISVECEPGKCLVCIARPRGSVELDA